MNQSVIITGASSGIGRETVAYFSKKGWRVAATMRNPQDETELNQLSNVKLFKLDVNSTESVKEAIAKIFDYLETVDVLVNNAGFGLIGPFEGATEEQIFNQFNTNVFGLMRVTKEILPYFRAQEMGRIINISSIAGRLTFPIYSLYNSSKYAVEGFSEALQYELKPFNIKVKLIEPGPIKTRFNTTSKAETSISSLPAYDEYTRKANAFYDENFNRGANPSAVAKAVYKAATSPCWRMRYQVGFQAKLFITLSKLIPKIWFRFITSKAIFLR